MRFSKLGSITKKTRAENDNEMMEFIIQGGQAKQVSAGIYTYGTMLTKAKDNLCNFIRQKLEKYECAEVALPLLQSVALWKASGRYDKFVSSGTMFTTKGRSGEYCISPTGEEMMLDYANTVIKSYKDMPVCLYQFSPKFRDEIRVRGGILRSKEFLMKDAYSFSDTPASMEQEYAKMRQCYIEIFTELGLDIIPVMACNGDMGGKISEEFMTPSELGEDTILLDEKSGRAFNIEVVEDENLLTFYKNKYPEIDFENLKRIRTMELGHIFQLDQFYSKSMNGTFTNKDGQQDYYYMGCYGIGVTRALGALIDKFKDEKGINFPAQIAPYTFGIANMPDKELDNVAFVLYDNLLNKGVKVLWDDRDYGIGYKLKDLQLVGVRNNIIIGKNYKETGKIELETAQGKFEMTPDELVDELFKK